MYGVNSVVSFTRNHLSEQTVGNDISSHSEIKRGITESGIEYLCKQYGSKCNGFDMHQAETIMSHMAIFRSLASRMHIPLAPSFLIKCEQSNNEGKVILLELQPYLGRDLKEVLADPDIPDTKARGYIDDYLTLFKIVKNNGSPIALDPVPANFCITNEDMLVYVDMMPPRYQHKKKIVSEWPDPPVAAKNFIYNRYFGPVQARVVYAQLLFALVKRFYITPEEIKVRIKEKLGEQSAALLTISERVKYRALEDPFLFGPDVLRIIAAEGFYNGTYTLNQLIHVYTNTHINAGGLLPSPDALYEATKELKKPRPQL